MSNTSSKSVTPAGRLWVVTELYYPEMTSTGYYLTKIAEGLANSHDVSAICGQPNYSARGTTAPKREMLNGVDVYRVYGTRMDKNVIPFRILNMITLSVSVFVRCLVSFSKDDKVLVVTTPPLMPFLTGFAAKVRGADHILLIHDRYPEILYAAGKLEKGSFVSSILERFSKSLIRNATGIIAVGRDMKQALLEYVQESKIDVIPNWAELESVSPESKESNKLLAETGLGDRFVLLYAGNMGYPNDIETILTAAERIKDELPEIHFVFLGAGVKKQHLVKSVKSRSLKNITVLDGRPRTEQQDFLNACDIGIVSLVKLMKGVSMPSRTYNILAAGKPILALCDKGSEISKVIEEDEVGWIVEPGDEDRLVRVLKEIFENRSVLAEKGKNARKSALENYTLDRAIASYRSVLFSDS